MTKSVLKTYEDWTNAGFVTIPCANKKSVVEKWSSPEFKTTIEEWKNHHHNKQIAIRLEKHVDFDIDHPKVKYFVKDHLKYCGAVFGRKNNPTSHYLFKASIQPKKFILPNSLKQYCEKEAHGATLCEIRSGIKEYTVVPESQYHLGKELIEWEHYESIAEYPTDLTQDVGRIALQAALCILYPTTGSRDAYCTAIAGVLLKHASWTTEQIDHFVHRIAIESKDDEAQMRSKKGTTHDKSDRKFGMTKLATIVGCDVKTIAYLFQWIGIGYKTIEGASAIGDIIEYAKNKYEVKIYGSRNGEAINKLVKMDGPTLRDMKKFYDVVIAQAGIWVPRMKPVDFETIVKNKFEERIKSKDYIEGDAEAEVFIKHFLKYLEREQVATNPIRLLEFDMPIYRPEQKYLDFKVSHFEDYLDDKRYNYGDRNDLRKKLAEYLDAKEIRNKIKDENNIYQSCMHFRIPKFKVDKTIIIYDNEEIKESEQKVITHNTEETKEVKIDFESDAIKD
jgi:hypothetical protein